MIFSERLLGNNSKVVLTVSTNPASATCTLTYNGVQYTTKSLEIDKGSTVSYSVYHSTYGTTSGTVVMDSDKILTCNGTYSTSSTETKWSQPTLSSNGTLGGTTCAAYCPTITTDNYQPYDCLDGVEGDTYDRFFTHKAKGQEDGYFTFYTPDPIKMSKIVMKQAGSQRNSYSKSGSVYASNSNGSWTKLTDYSNSSGNQTVTINLTTSNFYKYYQITCTSSTYANTGGYYYWSIKTLTFTATYMATAYTYYWDKTVTNGKLDSIPWEQPILTANSTIGGSEFAVEASSESSTTYAAWKAFDDDSSSTYWRPSSSTETQTYTFYNPDKINVTEIQYKFTSTTYNTTIDSIEGSNDNETWTTINRSDSTNSATITSTLSNTSSYKYYRTTFTPKSSGTYRLRNILITAVQPV